MQGPNHGVLMLLANCMLQLLVRSGIGQSNMPYLQVPVLHCYPTAGHGHIAHLADGAACDVHVWPHQSCGQTDGRHGSGDVNTA